MDRRIAILTILVSLGLHGCVSHRLHDKTVTLSRMNALNGAVKQFVRTRGAPPADLEEVCTFLTSCPEQRKTGRDAWGTRFLYETDSLDFVIRSAWQDREMFTFDDLLFSSAQQASAARTVSGCYQLFGSTATAPSMTLKLTDSLGEHDSFRVEVNGAFQGWWSPFGDYLYIQLVNGSHLLHAVFIRAENGWTGYLEGAQLGYNTMHASRVACTW